jgi:hypothetical protein
VTRIGQLASNGPAALPAKANETGQPRVLGFDPVVGIPLDVVPGRGPQPVEDAWVGDRAVNGLDERVEVAQ